MAYNITQLSTFFTNANAGTGPTAAQTLSLQALANQNAAGTLSNDQAFAQTVDLASDSTTAVSVGTYQFFLGFSPSQGGLANLNAAYVAGGSQASLNGENRFIAQAVSLALSSGKASFSGSYGSMQVADAARAAYDIIIGKAAAASAGINVDNAISFLTSTASIAYYTAFVKANVPGLAAGADTDLAVKAAIVGEIMYAATSFNNGAGVGSYASATTTLIKDLADDGVLAANNVNGIDLFGAYGGTGTPGSTIVLTTGVDTIVGTGNNDTINAVVSPVTAGGTPTTTWTALDTIDGGAGNDTLNLSDVTGGTNFATANVTVKNVETVKLSSTSTSTVDTSSWTGVTSLQTTTVGGVAATAATTTNITVTDGALGAGSVAVNGGSAVSVTTATTGNGTIAIGGSSAPTGAVTVKASVAGVGGNLTQGTINVTGGTTVSVTTSATQDTVNKTTTQAAVTVTGASATTAVTVNQTAAVAADATTKGIGAGDVTITDANGSSATKVGTIATVTVANAGNVGITDNSLATLNVSGKVGTVGVTTGAGATISALALNLGAGTTGAVTLGSNYKTLNVATSGANTVANISSGATALNVSGTDVLTLTSAAGLTAATAVTVTGAAGLKADLSGLSTITTVDTTGTTGSTTVSIGATKVAYSGGAGADVVTLVGSLASGSSISLGAGNDKLLGSTAVAASTTSVIDGGAGVDTVASSLINVGNAALFKNFEVLGLTSAANTIFDVSLVSGITGLELASTQAGTTAYTNVATTQSLSVTADVTSGSSTVLSFASAGVTGTADAYTIGFNAVGGTTATTINGGTVTFSAIENITVQSGSASGLTSNVLTLADADARTVAVTGSQALSLSFATNFGNNGTHVSQIDGSAATGAITLSTANVVAASGGLTVATGSGADVVTLTQAATLSTGAGNDAITVGGGASTVNAGAGDDTITVLGTGVGSSITTGGGADKVVVTAAIGSTGITVTDFVAGDSLVFGSSAGTFSKATIGTVTNLTDALTAASSSATAGSVSWFTYGGDTYVVQDNTTGTNGLSANDILVKLTGVVDLTNATLTNATGTLAL